ncbi:dipeptide ABC transporter ATP-binding protein [Brevibacterium album]|uniref:dipeptide ABC transporter ATP-binding protein n=1 Tax=Brevibacterium album TaxID=417948 RepID=UPI0004914F97|nr:ABC transporter ATP-binding protein [Brevibacterium album]
MGFLELRDFGVDLLTDEGSSRLVAQVDLSLERGELLCIVGESGSGKTLTSLSLARLLEYTSATVPVGHAALDGEDLLGLDQTAMNRIRGSEIGVVFQESMEALNPSCRIEDQLVEAARRMDREAARAKALRLMEEVGIPDPAGTLRKYPHQLSGGMQQRVMIAMALINDPSLLIADEPTTALDVTVQAEILRIIRNEQATRDMACIFITHDIGVAAYMADRIAVMYSGRVVEAAPAQELLENPRHPYTRRLLECMPKVGRTGVSRFETIPGRVPNPSLEIIGCRFQDRCAFATDVCRTETPQLLPVSAQHEAACWNQEAVAAAGFAEDAGAEPGRSEDTAGRAVIARAEDVSKSYRSRASLRRSHVTRALDGVSLEIREGEFLGLVGESGSGKTTLGRILAGIETADAGTVSVQGHEHSRRRAAVRELRRNVQVVFQNPHGTLDPRLTIRESVSEPMIHLGGLSKRQAHARAAELMSQVGLPEEYLDHVPDALSGGQKQRVSIARAISISPALLIADEPTSALDVSVQGQIMNVLLDLREQTSVSYLFITHNLNLVLNVADRVAVMHGGRIVEVGTPEEIIGSPRTEYTRRLLAANVETSI